jgi:hypothetical protein
MPIQELTREHLQEDLKRGKLLEDFVAEYFSKRGWAIHRAKGKVPAYDLIITKGTKSLWIEVKHDILSDTTGNYCLEQKSLSQSKSHILIIGTREELYALPMETARELFNEYPKRQTGDFADNISALIPKYSLINNSLTKKLNDTKDD